MLEVEVLGEPAQALTPRRARELCVAAAAARGVADGHVAIEFVDEPRIRELNARHRGKDQPTDVLSFPIDGAERSAAGPRELGDIVICAAHTADVPEAIVHGMLHLLGLDHDGADGDMLALQQRLLAANPA
jgi:probable rRNA maturation factor